MLASLQNIAIPLALAVPFLGALLILASPARLTRLWSVIASAVTLAVVATLPAAVHSGQSFAWEALTLVPGVAIKFRLDALGVTFAALASGLWFIASFYSFGYADADKLKHQPRFFSSFSAAVGTALGVAMAGNLLTFLLFYEMLTLSTWPLVAHKENPEAIAGGRKYLAYTLIGGLSLTTAVAWTWAATGQLDFVGGGFLQGQAPGAIAALFVLFMIGAGVKAAIMPAHSWLPAAMVAPTPVSALLHAVAVVKAGVFGCIRVMGFVFGPAAYEWVNGPRIILILCAATIVIGSVVALRQDHLKRRLAFSTIVHLSYIVLGAALMSELGITGSVLHMVNHGLTKITLFFCAGAIYATTHLDQISQFRGLGRRMPFTFGMFGVASLSLMGVPGLCGFMSKLYLARGAIEAHQYAYLAVMLGGSLFTAAYLLPVVWTAFFHEPEPDKLEGVKNPAKGDANLTMRLSLIATAILTLIFGLVPAAVNLQVGLARDVAKLILGVTP